MSVLLERRGVLTHHGNRSLDTLANEIREAHGLVEASARSTVEYAIRAGELLIAAKAKLEHGAWLPWLEANFPAGTTTAQAYMRVAANAQRVAHLDSYREALAELAEPRVQADSQPEPAVETADEPDEVQQAIIENNFRQKGEDAARESAEAPEEFERAKECGR